MEYGLFLTTEARRHGKEEKCLTQLRRGRERRSAEDGKDAKDGRGAEDRILALELKLALTLLVPKSPSSHDDGYGKG